LDKYQPVVTSDHKPYGIHRARQPEWFEDPEKIICVRKTRYPKFTVVPEAWYGDQAVLIIRLTKHAQISPHFAVAILNSKVGHFWLFQQKRQGNQLQVDKEVLLHFPFPNVNLSKPQDKKLYDDVINLAIKAVEQRRELETTRRSEKDIFGEKTKEFQAAIEKTKGEIDQLVFVLYGLTTKEIQQVENVAGGT
jgi:adenine-specific DNA-methyltransferase